MDGPEYLEVGGPPRRRRTAWLAVGLAVLVVGGLGIVRLGGLPRGPVTNPSPTISTPPSASSRAWPVGSGLPSGTLYVAARDGVHALDVGSGLDTKVEVDVDLHDTTLTPLANGVLAWTPDGGPKRLLVASASGALSAAGAELGSANIVLPGPDGQVWVAKLDHDHIERTVRYTLTDGLGGISGRTRFAGYPLTDGSGGLFALDETGVGHIYPGPAEKPSPGSVVAIGPDGYIRSRCTEVRCVTTLYDLVGGATRITSGLQDEVYDGVLSGGNRFVVAVTGGEEQASVREVGSGRVLRSFPVGAVEDWAVWLDDRWLAAISGGELVLYDATTDRLVTPALPFTRVSHLVWRSGG